MIAAAFTDLVLAIAAFAVASGPGQGLPGLRISSLVIGIAALVGAITFADLLPLYGLHDALTLLATASGLPLLAVSLMRPALPLVRRPAYAWAFALVAAAAGLAVVGLNGPKALLDGVAIVAMLAILLDGALRLDRPRQMVGLLLLLGGASFRLGFNLGAQVPPAAFLHSFMAAAFLVILRFVSLAQREAEPTLRQS